LPARDYALSVAIQIARRRKGNSLDLCEDFHRFRTARRGIGQMKRRPGQRFESWRDIRGIEETLRSMEGNDGGRRRGKGFLSFDRRRHCSPSQRDKRRKPHPTENAAWHNASPCCRCPGCLLDPCAPRRQSRCHVVIALNEDGSHAKPPRRKDRTNRNPLAALRLCVIPRFESVKRACGK